MKKKGITTWIRKKKVRYAAAGTLCLAVAIGILVLGLGIGSRAAETSVKLGDLDVNFDTITESGETVYLVENTEQMSKLGQASADQTKEKTFRLNQDLDIGITSAATGTFAGTFDGDGHVIKINQLNITDSTPGTETQGVSQGALFGTVSGTVENLIIDVTAENASYERISDAGVKGSIGTPSETEADKKYAFDTDTTVNEFSTGDKEKAAYEAIRFTDAFETVYLNAEGKECAKGDTGANEYRKYISNATSSTTTTYEVNNATQTDTIGILCGAIGNGGTVDRVSLNGNSVTVIQAGKTYPVSKTTSTVTPYAYYYRVGSEKRIEAQNMEPDTIGLEIPAVTQNSSVTATNQELGQLLSMEVSAPSAVATDKNGAYTINYTISLSSVSGTISKVTMKSSLPGGTFKGLDSNSAVTNLTKAGATITYTYTGNITTGDSVTPVFTALIEDAASGQTVPATAKASTSIVNGRYSLYTEQAGNGHPLELTVSSPKGILLNDASAESATTTFDVTVRNKGTEAMSDVQIYYGSDVTPVSSDEISIDLMGKTVTIKNGLAANTGRTVQFTKTASFGKPNSVMISANFSASATLADTKSQVITVGVEGTTDAYKTEGTVEDKKTIKRSYNTDGVYATASTQEMLMSEELPKKITYKITAQNKNLGEKIAKLTISSVGTNGKFSVKSGDNTDLGTGASYSVSTDEQTVEVTNLAKGKTITVYYTETLTPVTGDTYTEKFSVKTDENNEQKTIELSPKIKVYQGTNTTSDADLKAEVNGPQNSVRSHEDAQLSYSMKISKKSINDLVLTTTDAGKWTGNIISGKGSQNKNPVAASPTTGKITYNLADMDNGTWAETFTFSSESKKWIYPGMSLVTNLTAGTAKDYSAAQTTLTGGEISLQAEAPAMVLREASGDTYVIYELTPTWKTGVSGTTKLTASVAGGFGTSAEDAKAAEAMTEYTVSGKAPVYFARKVGSGDTNISTLFTMTCTSGDVVYRAQTAAVSTEIKAATDQIEPVEKTVGSLKATLTGTPSFLTAGQKITLTLTLQNISDTQTDGMTNNAHLVYVDTTEWDGWTVSGADWSGNGTYTVNASSGDNSSVSIGTTYKTTVLNPGTSIVLTKTIGTRLDTGKESLTLTGADIYMENTPSYTYIADFSGKPQVTNPKPQETESKEQLEAGQNLTVGALAGKSEGTIKNIRQNMMLTATKNTAENKGTLILGGVTGELSRAITDLYMTGSAKTSTVGAQVGMVTGKNSGGTLSQAVIQSATSADELGITDTGEGTSTVKTGVNAQPDDNWECWKTYSYYENENNTEMGTYFDLSWLVKKAETESDGNIFTLAKTAANEKIAIDVAETEKMTDQPLQYLAVYQARKTLTDDAYQRYSSEESNLALKKSGYYQPVTIYATDGYYQYVQNYENITTAPDTGESVKNYKTYYPYDKNSKPEFFDEKNWKVVRTDGTLEDTIQAKLKKVDSKLQVYYGDKGSEKAEIFSDIVSFPFTANTITIKAVPVLDGRIYEESKEHTFTAKNRSQLPAPLLYSTGYYDHTGKALEKEFRSGSSYEVNGTFLARPQTGADGCTYEYAFVDNEIEQEWKGKDDTGLSWTTESIEDLKDLWKSAKEGVIDLPEEKGLKHLYIRVTRENYPTTIYYFGTLTLTSAASVKAKMYYQYKDGAENEEIPNGEKILPGDTLVFDFDKQAAMTKVRYLILNKPLSNEAGLWIRNDWKEYSVPVQMTNTEDAAACYLYVQMSGDGDEYSKIESYSYLFGRITQEPLISPRTVDTSADSSSAAEIESGTQISLSGQDSDTCIFYLTGENIDDVKMEVSRLSGNGNWTSGKQEDGSYYYQAGKRWYQIKATKEIKQYDSSSEEKFYNDTDDPQTRYVGAVAIGSSSSPSSLVTYVYKVKPAEPVSEPEASLPTQYTPDGRDLESAVVEKGSYVSFRSLTSGAELLYQIGSKEVAEIADEDQTEDDKKTGTLKYNSNEGILVEGDYGATFSISIRAVKWNSDHTVKEMKSSKTLCFTYTIAPQKQALKPTATPATQESAPTTVTPGDKILLSSSTKGAIIYYTIDGSTPVVEWVGKELKFGENTKPYNAGEGIIMPLDEEGYFTVHAIAVAEDYKNSQEAIFIYAYPDAVQSPYANIPSGSVDLGTKVLLKNRTEGASIHYTIKTDGTEPADPTISSSVFDETQPIVINGKTVIKAFAVKNSVKSAVVTLTYTTKDQLAPPEASIESGAMVSRGTKLKLTAASGATIYYTTDGSDPTDSSNSSVVSGTNLVLDGAAGSQVTVKAYAVMDGKSASEVMTFTYQISKNTGGVTADVANGTEVSNGSKVNLMTDVTGAEIYYTTDGSSPADSGIKGTVVTINGTSGSTVTIKAVAKVNGDAGMVCTFTYRIKERPTAPTASPSGGELTIARRVELSSSAEKIYYTTDGTTPTESSNLYKEPVLINRTTTLKAIAVSKDGEISEVASFQYTAAARADMPKASYESGSIVEPGTIITLRTDTANAQIYYSTDGTDPTLDTLDNLLKYTEEGIMISRTVTVKAVAYREDLQLSKTGTFQYVVDTILAVEAKKEAEAQAEAEALHDTDASGLARADDFEETAYEERVLRESECSTVVSGTDASIEDDTVLVTKKEDCSDAAAKNVKKLFGEDYKILSSYNMYLMRGGSMVQPNGQVEIGIPIPSRYENAAVTIVYIDSNDKITRQETRRKDGMAYAYTDHFSNYALVGLEDPESGNFQIPWLLLLQILAGLSLLGGLGYFISKKLKKNR